MSDMSTADILRKAKAYISDPKKWNKGSYFKSDCGLEDGFDYTCACALGAIKAVILPEAPLEMVDNTEAAETLGACIPDGRRVHIFNDDYRTTHADIMALYDRAIAAAETSQ